MRRLLLFIVMCGLAGFGAAIGSILGNGMGKRGLFAGAIVGGIVGVTAGAWFAAWRRWIPRDRRARTAIGGALGFLAAAAIAVNTLSSPVGPVLSTLLVGVGALVGSRGGPPNEHA